MRLEKTSVRICVQPDEKRFKFLKLNIFILLFLFLCLMVPELPAKEEVDYFKQMGLLRPDKTTYAPNFVLPDLNGDKIGLSKYQGKFVMLNFWATW